MRFVMIITTKDLVHAPIIEKKKCPKLISNRPKGILLENNGDDILLKPHLIHPSSSTGSSYKNPVEQIHARKSTPSKRQSGSKSVNFLLPHATVRIEGALEDNKVTTKIPKRIKFHNKLIHANDDLRTAKCYRQVKMGNLAFLTKKYGQRLSIDGTSIQKRIKREVEVVHPRPKKQLPLTSLFKKTSPKRFNWTTSFNKPILHASSPSKATKVNGLFTDALPLSENLPANLKKPNESKDNTTDAIMNNPQDNEALSPESLEMDASKILDFYDFQDIKMTSTPTNSIVTINANLKHPVSPVYSENSFFQDEQSFISTNPFNEDIESTKKSDFQQTISTTIESNNVTPTPSKTERHALLSPPCTPPSASRKTCIDISGM